MRFELVISFFLPFTAARSHYWTVCSLHNPTTDLWWNENALTASACGDPKLSGKAFYDHWTGRCVSTQGNSIDGDAMLDLCTSHAKNNWLSIDSKGVAITCVGKNTMGYVGADRAGSGGSKEA